MRKRLLVCISAMLCIVTAAACSKADKSISSEQTVSVNEAVISDTEKEQLTKRIIQRKQSLKRILMKKQA